MNPFLRLVESPPISDHDYPPQACIRHWHTTGWQSIWSGLGIASGFCHAYTICIARCRTAIILSPETRGGHSHAPTVAGFEEHYTTIFRCADTHLRSHNAQDCHQKQTSRCIGNHHKYRYPNTPTESTIYTPIRSKGQRPGKATREENWHSSSRSRFSGGVRRAKSQLLKASCCSKQLLCAV